MYLNYRVFLNKSHAKKWAFTILIFLLSTSAFAYYPGTKNIEDDVKFIEEVSLEYVQDIQAQAKADFELTNKSAFRKFIQKFSRAYVASDRFTKMRSMIVRNNPDVILVDLTLRTIKYSVVYPSLYRAGYAWMIPTFGNTILGTDVWSTSYYVVRNWVRSQKVRKIYGHAKSEILKFKDELLGTPLSEEIHRYALETQDGERVELNVRDLLYKDFIPVLAPTFRAPGVARIKELEGFVADKDFLFFAKDFKTDIHLYAKILLLKIMSDPQSASRFLEWAKKLQNQLPEPKIKPLGQLLVEIDIFRKTLTSRMEWVIRSTRELRKKRLKLKIVGRGWTASVKLRTRMGEVNQLLNEENLAAEQLELQLLSSLMNGTNPDLEKAKLDFEVIRKNSLKKIELAGQFKAFVDKINTLEELENFLIFWEENKNLKPLRCSMALLKGLLSR